MFGTKVKALVVTAVLSVGTLFVANGSAQADNLNIGVYLGSENAGIYVGKGNRHGHRDYYRHDYRPAHYYGHGRHRHSGYHDRRRSRVCTPRRAVRKAHRMGIRRAHVQKVRENRIVVKGRSYGNRAKVVFNRWSPHCAVIKTKGVRWY